jgi:nuclear inhibitor of protein phosphatase 1
VTLVEMYRSGLDRFKKAETLEPFSVQQSASGAKGAPRAQPAPLVPPQQRSSHPGSSQGPHAPQSAGSGVAGQEAGSAGTQLGGGQSTWQPPDWAIEPRPGVYYLEVLKDGHAIDRINLDKKRHIFGRQVPACEFVLDHQSVSRQHAAVVPHKNGRLDTY